MKFHRRMALAGLAVALLASPALANSEDKSKGKPEVVEGLELLNVPLPVARNGKLVNYLYVSTKITTDPKRDIWKLRESTHFLREGIVLAAHRTDFSDPANPEKIDMKRITAMIAAETTKVYGAGIVKKVEITAVDSKRTGIAKRYAPPTVTASAGSVELNGLTGLPSSPH